MFELRVETEFAAAHAIVLRGEREGVHGHNWRVEVTVAGRGLDSDGLLVDFHAVEGWLREITQRFHNRNLNEVPPFDEMNPTAERVAEHIAGEVGRRLSGGGGSGGKGGGGVWVESVLVTEAPGCAAVWRRGG